MKLEINTIYLFSLIDYYLRKLNNVIPINNMDSYGCTLFHSINLFKGFNVKSLRPELLNVSKPK